MLNFTLKKFMSLKITRESTKNSDKSTYICPQQNSFATIALFFVNIMKIRAFPLHNKKEVHVCHHAMFFIIKPKLSEEMAKFSHT